MSHPLQPDEHYRLHFSRARHFTDINDNLVRLCTVLAQEGSWEHRNAARHFEDRLRLFPNLAGLDEKTMANYFTEVTSLFSLYTLHGETASAGQNAVQLADSQDLIAFFAHHMRKFQFPNGHLKKSFVLQQVNKGLRFKPGNYFVRLLLEGQRIVGDKKSFGISPDEATWFGTNDLRALRGERTPEENASRILAMRGKVDLNPPADVVAYGLPSGIRGTPADFKRYARDCLTMLEFAGVVVRGPDGRRYLRPSPHVPALLADTTFFDDFSAYTSPDVSPEEFDESVERWLIYATTIDNADAGEVGPGPLPEIPEVAETILDQVLTSADVDTAAIGSHGEAIAITHERNRLRSCGRDDLARRVRKLPDQLGVGYDLESFECDGRHRCVEVKTTQSVSPVHFRSFHLTTNEWLKAEALGASYVVYRISLSDALGAKLQTLVDPVGLYKGDKIQMIPRSGADVTFSDGVATEVDLMLHGS